MDLILSVGIIMIWVAVAMILYMTYLGFDVRSRGFKASGGVQIHTIRIELFKLSKTEMFKYCNHY